MPARRLAIPLLLLVVVTSLAQAGSPKVSDPPSVSPAWSLHFDSEVQWQWITPLGHLLVKSATMLSGIDPDTGRVLWTKTDLGSLAEDQFEEIPGTPLVMLSDGLAKPRVIVLNSIDGRVLFDSRQSGVVQVVGRFFLPRQGGLLLLGFREGKPVTTMFMIDVASGKLLWENDQLLGKAGKFTKLLTALVQAATNESGIAADPMEIPGDMFLMASVTDLYAIDSVTGRIRWQAGNAHDARRTRFFLTENTPGVVYAATETATQAGSSGNEILYTYYSALRLSDGGEVWPKPVRLKGGLNDVIFTDDGLIVSPLTEGKGKINLIDYADGTPRWGKKGKGIQVLGGIVDHQWTDAGIVLTTGYDSAWTNKGTEYFLNVLNPRTGALRFEDSLKVRGRILSTEVLPRGVLFTTTSEVNMLDLSTGRPLFTESIRSDDSLITADSDDLLYAFAAESGTLYRVDKKQGSVVKLSRQPVKLEEDESPLALEVTPGQITVISSQNVVAFSPDGTVRFHAYHASPRLPALMRVLLRAQQIRMGMAAFVAGSTSAALAHAATRQEEGTVDRTVTSAVAQGYGMIAEEAAGLAGQYGRLARTRFKASAVSTESVFMMIKLGGGDHAIARVSKRTGRIESAVNLGRDKTPSYQVDGVTDQVFYRPRPTEIVGYKF